MRNTAVLKVFLCLVALAFCLSCSRRLPSSFGRFDSVYSCLALYPIYNETSFSPLNELLSGYLNLEMYHEGFQEIITPSDLKRIFVDEGKVYFPKRFNQSQAMMYSTLLGLDGVLYGTLSSPDRASSDSSGRKKLLNVELYFLSVRKSSIVWSYNEMVYIHPGQYNIDMRRLSKRVLNSLKESGFRYARGAMPCWDVTLAGTLKNLPALTKETFNTLSHDIAEAEEDNIWLNLGNVFMTLGKRSLALAQYKKFLKQNPASPFRGEVEKQVAIIERQGR